MSNRTIRREYRIVETKIADRTVFELRMSDRLFGTHDVTIGAFVGRKTARFRMRDRVLCDIVDFTYDPFTSVSEVRYWERQARRIREEGAMEGADVWRFNNYDPKLDDMLE